MFRKQLIIMLTAVIVITTNYFLFRQQGIVPESATTQVKELYVPEARVGAARVEAQGLATLDITEVLYVDSSNSLSYKAMDTFTRLSIHRYFKLLNIESRADKHFTVQVK